MKALRVSAAVLVALIAVSLVNSAVLSARCGEWTTHLRTVTMAVGKSDWDTAEGEMAALQREWHRCQSYLHITLMHEEINEADTLLHQCVLYVTQRDSNALADAAVQLALQFDRLAEMERLSIKNVL